MFFDNDEILDSTNDVDVQNVEGHRVSDSVANNCNADVTISWKEAANSTK